MGIEALRRAVELAGGQTALAERIGSTQGHVSKWLEREQIPPHFVLPIERATGVSRHALRPDIYPAEFYGFREADTPPITGAPGTLPRRRWTVAEIEAMVQLGIVRENERFELLDGDPIVMSPKGNEHERIKGLLNRYWSRRLPDEYSLIPETTFRVSPMTFFEPDFVFFRTDLPLKALRPETALLIVEISHTSLDYDTGDKKDWYARLGIREYWVINAITLDTTVHKRPQDRAFGDVQTFSKDKLVVPEFCDALGVRLTDLKLV
jgi:Uma2 family endonuclease/DNA-binding transcriptional regulator YdaS (Cro superfamily)